MSIRLYRLKTRIHRNNSYCRKIEHMCVICKYIAHSHVFFYGEGGDILCRSHHKERKRDGTLVICILLISSTFHTANYASMPIQITLCSIPSKRKLNFQLWSSTHLYSVQREEKQIDAACTEEVLDFALVQ